MKNYLKYGGYFSVVALVIMQFIPVKKNNSNDVTKDITTAFPVPAEVLTIMKTSCYDCHSNNTVYPWYNAIQPVAFYLAHHVDEGQHEVNFNEFASYKPRRQYKKFNEIIEQIEEGEMPMWSYTAIHRETALNDTQKSLMINWAKAMKDTLAAHYPMDSLVLKKRG
jgi:Haem-binding domain